MILSVGLFTLENKSTNKNLEPKIKESETATENKSESKTKTIKRSYKLYFRYSNLC